MVLIAQAVDLEEVMSALAATRPVFHSEADFQHSFGQLLHDIDPALRIRLEVPRPEIRYGRVDLICSGKAGSTAIEFKYFKAPWTGTDGRTEEVFALRNHAASDVARRQFVFDISRLESLTSARPDLSGLAIMLSNAPGLWKVPSQNARITRDWEFRIHEGANLNGLLRWGSGDHPHNDRTLSGTYSLRWRKYSTLPDSRRGDFCWLGVSVGGTRSDGALD